MHFSTESSLAISKSRRARMFAPEGVGVAVLAMVDRDGIPRLPAITPGFVDQLVCFAPPPPLLVLCVTLIVRPDVYTLCPDASRNTSLIS